MKYRELFIDYYYDAAEDICHAMNDNFHNYPPEEKIKIKYNIAGVLLCIYKKGFEDALPDDLTKHFQLEEIDASIEYFIGKTRLNLPEEIIRKCKQ